ncbi:MAG: wax ester/triacylglycerol synthase family O-acyltransferase [Pseudomonadota bacterium]
MTKLSFQDAFFLRGETPTSHAHVAALMLFTPPDNAPADYLQRLAGKLGTLNELWPAFGRKLDNPDSLRTPSWIAATDYEASDHVLHYAVAEPGTMDELLRLVEQSHEELLDRGQPLWQVHLIEGLEHGRFAIYFKVHHAVMDGVAGLHMIRHMLSDDPRCESIGAAGMPLRRHNPGKAASLRAVSDTVLSLLKHVGAVPEAVGSLAQHSLQALLGHKDDPLPPFAAPRTMLNGEIDGRRRIVICDLPLRRVREIGKHYGGTINDVVLAVTGAALRDYLLDQDALPARTLDAGVPVSVRGTGPNAGNQLSFLVCPFATEHDDPVRRLKRVIRTTRKAKKELGHMSPAATEDLATMLMLPFLLMSMTRATQVFPPFINTIVSNVPGPEKPLYLDGARLERLYPLSVIMDGIGLNITVISCRTKLCFGITSCPTHQPGIDTLGPYLRRAYRELLATLD